MTLTHQVTQDTLQEFNFNKMIKTIKVRMMEQQMNPASLIVMVVMDL
jgi:hypothetical protein